MTIKKTNYSKDIIGVTNTYYGKVRDVYTINDKYLVLVASDRISAFDHILPKAIPFKGQVLNRIAAKNLKQCIDVCPNWLISSPHPNVSIGKLCDPIPLEMVVRNYLTGHAWREYKAGKRVLCGVSLPEGLKEHDKFKTPIITPTTKENEGHDEDISREEILAQGIVSEKDYEMLERYSLDLFERGTKLAAKKGLILVDTKYEFGIHNGVITLMDEIHTPDSSRYFYANGYEERQANGEKQKQLSKEFVREWLIDQGFQGLEGQEVPEMPDVFIKEVSERYILLYETLMGEKFRSTDAYASGILTRIREGLKQIRK